ncbi:MAG: putative DNA binding domain-containing protein [Deltaproteobacteria bacterium]|jgi:predicted HTH transcriptional regulator|nr:putative DNA binding domain-containing protein [Deltaproteobacteria bacterium]
MLTPSQLLVTLKQFIVMQRETEWLEFKCDFQNQEEIGEYISALSNSAALHRKESGFLIWGIADDTHEVVGTHFQPRQAKKGNEELENWLLRLLQPRINFSIHEFDYDGKHIVLFEILPASHTPVRFKSTRYIRIGTYKKKLKDYPEKERELWALFSERPFENGIAQSGVTSDDILIQIDYPACFDLTGIRLPDNRAGILSRLEQEKFIINKGEDRFDITNLGAILFAKDLADFQALSRKALRVILYRGINRIETIREQVGVRGYATGYEGAISFINQQLPQNEEIRQAFREEVRMFPDVAVRELVANAIIHQDFNLTGTGPMVEIFSDRIEITNPGSPLIDTLRFIDGPPRSRNETLASFMRRINICEERGSGIDKVIFSVELYQLPAPDFIVTGDHTKAILYARKDFAKMDKNDRIRACYQHACLRYVSSQHMNNESLRNRMGIEDKSYPMASRIIKDSIEAELIKPYDPKNKSRKHAKYIPFWA